MTQRQEINRMKIMLSWWRKLSPSSRGFVLWLLLRAAGLHDLAKQVPYNCEDAP